MKKLITLLVLSVAALSAQVADPPYDAPNAQYMAEMRYALNFGLRIPLMPPPVGWACSLTHDWIGAEGRIPYTWAACEPDPGLVSDQEYGLQEWLWEQDRLRDFTLRRRR